MSENRSYFSYRYAFPGFIFVLLIFLINLDLILSILRTNLKTIDLSAIVSIVTLLSGPSIGFIIAQFWYYLFDILGIHRRFWEGSRHALWVSGIFKSKKSWESDLWKTEIDYWMHGNKETGKRWNSTLDYLTRRWDLFHSLSITAFSMILGLAIGFGTRWFLYNYFGQLINQPSDYQSILLFYYRFFIVLASTASILALIFGAWGIRNEHQSMIIEILRRKEEQLIQGRTMKTYLIVLAYEIIMFISAIMLTYYFFNFIGIMFALLFGLLIVVTGILIVRDC